MNWLIPIILGFYILYLIWEKFQLSRIHNSIPIRIAVTGTRGKSTVVRLLFSCLARTNHRSLAKTTGSKACYLLPDQKEREISRRGSTSIIEQKDLLKLAANLEVDYLISELMAIQPEYQFAESHKIVKPHILVITNVYEDHIDAMGKSIEEIAHSICQAIRPGTTVFMLKKECLPLIREACDKNNCQLIEVASPSTDVTVKEIIGEYKHLIRSILHHLNISDDHLENGFSNYISDSGAFTIWRYHINNRTCYFANGFAANDPRSTKTLIKMIKSQFQNETLPLVGLISLRKDRTDRTLQWIKALKTQQWQVFDKLYVHGFHASLFKRHFPNAQLLSRKMSASTITEKLCQDLPHEAIVFGFGNFKGLGAQLVNLWQIKGENYGI